MSNVQPNNKNKVIKLIGAASCVGAQDTRCDMGPTTIRATNLVSLLGHDGVEADWEHILHAQASDNDLDSVTDLCEQLAHSVNSIVKNQQQFAVIGGDHSCAIGTWSGAADALGSENTLGLIWIDAHMDCHTPETSPSGAYHGMPLACLLGNGPEALREISNKTTKLSAENICLVGVRSFESEESSLLNKLGVKIFYIDEIKQRGLTAVMKDALAIVENTTGFGISIDLDAIDPVDAPGVGSPTQDGLQAEQLLAELASVKQINNFIGCEITEFNPYRDVNNKTANLIVDLIRALA